MGRKSHTWAPLRVERWQVGPKHVVVAGGEGVKTRENKIRWPRWLVTSQQLASTQLSLLNRRWAQTGVSEVSRKNKIYSISFTRYMTSKYFTNHLRAPDDPFSLFTPFRIFPKIRVDIRNLMGNHDLKVPKCEIFDPFFFTPINPIWVGDLRTGEKNLPTQAEPALKNCLRRLSLR